MARRPASGRGWTDDGRATGKSFRHPLEAWWKHEGENRCAILTIRAQFGLVALSRNWQDMRKKTRFVAPDRVSFDTTHNLKVVGSNPTPATSFIQRSQDVTSRPPGGVLLCATRGSTVEARRKETPRNQAHQKLSQLKAFVPLQSCWLYALFSRP